MSRPKKKNINQDLLTSRKHCPDDLLYQNGWNDSHDAYTDWLTSPEVREGIADAIPYRGTISCNKNIRKLIADAVIGYLTAEGEK